MLKSFNIGLPVMQLWLILIEWRGSADSLPSFDMQYVSMSTSLSEEGLKGEGLEDNKEEGDGLEDNGEDGEGLEGNGEDGEGL